MPTSSSGASSSIEISPEGRSWVITLSTLGEPGPLKVGETNPDVKVAGNSLSGSDISGSSPISLVDEKLLVTSETDTDCGL
jgi:hypothetical protein